MKQHSAYFDFAVMQESRLRLGRCNEASSGDLDDIPNLCPRFWIADACRRASPAGRVATPSRWRTSTALAEGQIRWLHRGIDHGAPVAAGGQATGAARTGVPGPRALQGLLRYLSISRADLASGSFGGRPGRPNCRGCRGQPV